MLPQNQNEIGWFKFGLLESKCNIMRRFNVVPRAIFISRSKITHFFITTATKLPAKFASSKILLINWFLFYPLYSLPKKTFVGSVRINKKLSYTMQWRYNRIEIMIFLQRLGTSVWPISLIIEEQSCLKLILNIH